MINWIVVLPFLSSFLMTLVYLSNTKKRRYVFFTIVGVGTPVIITILSFILGFQILHDTQTIYTTLFKWISIGDFDISIAFMVDSLSVVMISFITFIGTLIHIYATGYMKEDKGYGKFFAYFNFFMGSMLLLVLADNPIVMFIGWELVGLSSYFLIGFHHHNLDNITAANKAFIVNRVGDFGFIMGISLLFVAIGGTGFTFNAIAANISSVSTEMLNLIGVLLFVGAMGKSAQIPLYVWLPDAMAGPTPVSALIHAATMVTAGVYMVSRYSFLYVKIPDVGIFIATIGAASALFAAVIASYQSDIKKILAYSTMSQLGYMFIAVGLGFYSSGVFHVFTHAFFKALLFMGAGAIILALNHEQNIFNMGGLKKHLKVVYMTMFIATLAISGIPPFAGFFSKDAILVGAFSSEHYVIWGVGTLTVGLTAFYMFRMLFTVFFVKTAETHELTSLPSTMTKPLIVLAIGSFLAGFVGVSEAYGGYSWINYFLSLPDTELHMTHNKEYLLSALNILLALVGMGVAYKVFATEAKEAKPDSVFRNLVIHKFYIDETYVFLIVKPLFFLSHLISKVIDPKLFDGFINLNVWGYRKAAVLFAKLQNGKVQYYALYILASVSVISYYLLMQLGVK